ncbi:MAG: hypothetical protein QSU88_13060, partial [Candidatus Methanoperedens sp.]|nr:hypothetical protein [Candidatus Methanoperedens sp.]
LRLMKKKVSNVPKLKTEASHSRLPRVTITINAITTPVIITVKKGTPFFETFESERGITCCLAIAKRALEPPSMEAITTDAVANSAEIEMNFSRKKLFVATFIDTSSGALDVPMVFQFNSPTSTAETPI